MYKSHVTIRDVARLANVSTKTVSRVINNQGEISAETRQRVQAAIDQLGYQPNIMARNLVQGRTDTLAVVAWGLEFYGPSRVVVGVEQQAAELGYTLLLDLLPVPDDPDVDEALAALAARRVDGIIWAIPEIGNNRDWIAPERLAQLPPIVFLSMAPRPNLTIVSVDNRAGGRAAASHLIARGRRRIGLITGPANWWESRERRTGWEEALRANGLTVDEMAIAEGDWSAESGERGAAALLEANPDLDAIFASNDQMALGAMVVARRSGRRVPEDIAIVGFDNIPESPFFWPPLTTVYQKVTDAGCIAVQQLHSMIQARRETTRPGLSFEAATILLPPELVERESSGSPH